MRLPVCGVLVFGMLTAGAPAFALSPDWPQCADVNNPERANLSLAACNRILKDASEARNHAMAFRNRCGIYYTKKDYDNAIADCSEAARREPQSAIVFERRGLIWKTKGDYVKAIADFDQAIRLNANFANAYYHRGESKRAKGDTVGGDADIARAKQIDPNIEK